MMDWDTDAEPHRERWSWFALVDALILGSMVSSLKSLCRNWSVRHEGRHLIYVSFACLGACLLFVALHIMTRAAGS